MSRAGFSSNEHVRCGIDRNEKGAYAILAGADFGGGILDLTCGKSPEQRAAIARTIGPLWEANHVWLIFAITILFSAWRDKARDPTTHRPGCGAAPITKENACPHASTRFARGRCCC
jgi:hypothetical protein